MKVLHLTITPFVLLSFDMFCWPVSGAEPPRVLYLEGNPQRPKPPKMAPVYIKKDTWHESLRASLETTFGPTAGINRAAAPSGFRPAIVRLTADAHPVRLEFRVDGLERLYFATLGRKPESGSAESRKAGRRTSSARGCSTNRAIPSNWHSTAPWWREGSIPARTGRRS